VIIETNNVDDGGVDYQQGNA